MSESLPIRHPTRNELGSDEAAIQYAVDAAETERRLIDDACARRIAGQFHSGQASSLYSLASTGAIKAPDLVTEILEQFIAAETDTERGWVEHLASYVAYAGPRDPIPGWYRLTADDAPVVGYTVNRDV